MDRTWICARSGDEGELVVLWRTRVAVARNEGKNQSGRGIMIVA